MNGPINWSKDHLQALLSFKEGKILITNDKKFSSLLNLKGNTQMNLLS
jgi:hypothetical protein